MELKKLVISMDRISVPRNWRLPLLLGLAFIALQLVGLDRSPVVWIDEVTLNDPARELAFNGNLKSAVFADAPGFETSYFWQPPGQPLITALVYRITGFGIWQTRVPGVIFGAGAIVALYFVARRLFASELAGGLSATMFALDGQFIATARSGRMDTQALFFAFLAILTYLHIENAGPERRLQLIGLSGLLAGLALITHPVSIVWIIALSLLICVIPYRSRWSELPIFTAFAALPAIAWLLYGLTRPTTFWAQFYGHGGGRLADGSFINRIVDDVSRYADKYELQPVVLAGYLSAIIWLLLVARYERQVKLRVLILWGVPFLFIMFGMTKHVGFYFLHPNAVLAVAGGALLAFVWSRWRTLDWGWPKFAVTLAVAIFAINLVGGGIAGRYVVLAFQWDERGYGIVESAVGEVVPMGAIVYGSPESWYAVIKAGATLRLIGEPDPYNDPTDPATPIESYQFIIRRAEPDISWLGGFEKIGVVGKQLPLIFGRFQLESAHYDLEIWKNLSEP